MTSTDSNRQPIENQPQIGGSSTLRTDTTGGCDRNESSLDPVRDDAHENQGHSAILGEQSPNRGFEEATGTRSISGADYGPRESLGIGATGAAAGTQRHRRTFDVDHPGFGRRSTQTSLPRDDRAQYRVRRATMSTLPGHAVCYDNVGRDAVDLLHEHRGYHCQLPRASAISKSPKPNEVKAWPATKEPSKDGESDGIGAGSSLTQHKVPPVRHDVQGPFIRLRKESSEEREVPISDIHSQSRARHPGPNANLGMSGIAAQGASSLVTGTGSRKRGESLAMDSLRKILDPGENTGVDPADDRTSGR